MQVVLISPLHYHIFFVANYISFILLISQYSALSASIPFLCDSEPAFQKHIRSFSIKSTFIVHCISYEGSYTFALYRFSYFFHLYLLFVRSFQFLTTTLFSLHTLPFYLHPTLVIVVTLPPLFQSFSLTVRYHFNIKLTQANS